MHVAGGDVTTSAGLAPSAKIITSSLRQGLAGGAVFAASKALTEPQRECRCDRAIGDRRRQRRACGGISASSGLRSRPVSCPDLEPPNSDPGGTYGFAQCTIAKAMVGRPEPVLGREARPVSRP
jgi:hypothetical protein